MLATSSLFRSLQLWRDRAGAFSMPRAVALALAIAPALPLLLRIFTHDLGPRPLTEVSHETGLWAVRLLAVTLAVTPLIALTRRPRLAAARRILGVSVFVWMVAHLIAFIADKSFDLVVVAQEIVLRVYLEIGFVALVMLAALAFTSTDGAIRKLGAARWRKLHLLVYPIVVLGLVHFFMQAKSDVTEPTAMAGIFALIFALRLPKKFGREVTPLAVVALSVVAAITTALAEAAWFSYKFGANVGMALAGDFDVSFGLRPCWWPLIAGCAFAALGLARNTRKPASPGARVQPQSANARQLSGVAAPPP